MIGYLCERGVASLTLDRPRCGNALSVGLMQALRQAVRSAADDPAVAMVVLRASGRHFCAGADLEWVRAPLTADAALWRQGMEELLGLQRDLYRLDKPLLARAQGRVVGAGVSLLCLCDQVIASQDMVCSLPEIRLGMVPTAVLPALRYRLGPSGARRLLLDARVGLGEQTLPVGLVDEWVGQGQLEAALQRRIESLQALPARTLARTKRLMRELDGHAFEQALEAVWPEALATLTSDDARERMAALRTGSKE
ncbi:MAG: hypothetical protein FGM55_16650 [Rhodoferax sp.]|nr:hypothetical protein [Rhodoferax sp.]